MKRNETRVQVLMAIVGSLLALVAFTTPLFAEDPAPTPPPGANYTSFDPNLTWTEGDGPVITTSGTLCYQEPPCIQVNYCFTPYPAVFGGVQYQSMKPLSAYNYGTCKEGPFPGSTCALRPTVRCADADLFLQPNCPVTYYPNVAQTINRDIYKRNACVL